jgi:AraC-like DNA-binding protein
MGQPVYQFSGSVPEFLVSSFADVLGEEICSGEIGAGHDASPGEVILEKGASLPVPIFSLRSRLTTTMRRTQRHVRETNKQFHMVWLIEKGRLSISTSSGVKVLAPGTVMVMDSRNPSYIEALIDETGEHRNMFALVPSHMIHAHIPASVNLNAIVFSPDGPDCRLVGGLIALLFRTGDDLAKDEASSLLDLMLRAVARLGNADGRASPVGQGMRMARHAQILSHIDLHLANSRLTMADVARMSGISTRYLAQIMRREGASFASVLRDRRLDLARRLLCQVDRPSIGEIAKIAGFGNGAQLSRVFRKTIGCTPSAYRRDAAKGYSGRVP